MPGPDGIAAREHVEFLVRSLPDDSRHPHCEELLEVDAAHRAEVARLTGLLEECNAVCLCGCPNSEHEADECGESCGHDDHECIRVAPSVLEIVQRYRVALSNALKPAPSPPAGDAVREAAERLALLRLVAAEGCRDEAGSGVSCRDAAVPPADVCEVCRVIEYLAALDVPPPPPAGDAVREAAERVRDVIDWYDRRIHPPLNAMEREAVPAMKALLAALAATPDRAGEILTPEKLTVIAEYGKELVSDDAR